MTKLNSQAKTDFYNYLDTLDPMTRTVLRAFTREALGSMVLLGPLVGVEPTVKAFRYLADIAAEALDYAKTEATRADAEGVDGIFDKLEAQLDPEEAALKGVSAFMPLPGIFSELKDRLEAKLNQAQLDYLDSVSNDTLADIKALREAVGPEQANLAVQLGSDIQMTFVPALIGGLSRESIITVLETILKQQRGAGEQAKMLNALATAAPRPAQAA